MLNMVFQLQTIFLSSFIYSLFQFEPAAFNTQVFVLLCFPQMFILLNSADVWNKLPEQEDLFP